MLNVINVEEKSKKAILPNTRDHFFGANAKVQSNRTVEISKDRGDQSHTVGVRNSSTTNPKSITELNTTAKKPENSFQNPSNEPSVSLSEKPRLEKNKVDIGVLLASHGDIDSMNEVESYIKTAYKKNDSVPIPAWLRDITKEPAYLLSRKIVSDQYKQIGPTHYRENSQKQVNALTKVFEDKNISARAYVGYNFTFPFVAETLEKMKQDGVKKIVLINQGAQFSAATGGENIKDVKAYLKKHPEWDVEVRVVNQFSDDPRFRELLAKSIQEDVKRLFPEDKPEDVSILMGSHGMPVKIIEKGDPAVPQMQHLVKDLRKRLHNFNIYHGYLNDDFIPGAKWIGPEASEVAEEMNHKGCRKVLLDGRLSFTVHHRATLYDLDKLARMKLNQKRPTQKSNQLISNEMKTNIQLAPNFDGNPEFAQLLSNISLEAIQGKGDISIIRNKMN
jgi:protoporphyrin/coproporphyrin ferrochelatase